MREIKFRAWWGKRLYFWEEICGMQLIQLEQNKEIVFMQYTGLKDKNGKEIYEGDIIHGSYGIPPIGVTSVVEYKESAFIIETKGHNPESVTLKTAIECLDIEVYGNIHENPELLK